MTLTKDYIRSQRFKLGDHANKTLDEINDEGLTERTLLYSNLRSVGRKNLNFRTDLIAQTVANILDARAWEDYVEVDGTRKSCESFPKWLEQNGVDIKLAKFALEEKKPEYLNKFTAAADGYSYTTLSAAVRKVHEDKRSSCLTAAHKAPSHRTTQTARWRARLEYLAETSDIHKKLYSDLLEGALTINQVAVQLGWRKPHREEYLTRDLNKVCPEFVQFAKDSKVELRELTHKALRFYLENYSSFEQS